MVIQPILNIIRPIIEPLKLKLDFSEATHSHNSTYTQLHRTYVASYVRTCGNLLIKYNQNFISLHSRVYSRSDLSASQPKRITHSGIAVNVFDLK